jgi:hypothetical protein
MTDPAPVNVFCVKNDANMERLAAAPVGSMMFPDGTIIGPPPAPESLADLHRQLGYVTAERDLARAEAKRLQDLIDTFEAAAKMRESLGQWGSVGGIYPQVYGPIRQSIPIPGTAASIMDATGRSPGDAVIAPSDGTWSEPASNP